MSEHLFSEDELKGYLKQQEEAEKKQKEAEKEAEKQQKEAKKQAEQARKIQIKISRTEKKLATPKEKPKRGHLNSVRSLFDSFFLILRTIFLFVLIFTISYLIINFPAISSNFKYVWKNTTTYNINNPPPQTKPSVMTNNTLSIPKISVNAPITWQVSENEILTKLQSGVASYAGTAMPGEQGNVFIFGHSSYYLWAQGNYKSVFALLDNLEVGDKIYIGYQDKTYTYQVTGKEVVNPDNLEIISSGNGNQLKLMTCVPIGTNLQRLIVTAAQI